MQQGSLGARQDVFIVLGVNDAVHLLLHIGVQVLLPRPRLRQRLLRCLRWGWRLHLYDISKFRPCCQALEGCEGDDACAWMAYWINAELLQSGRLRERLTHTTMVQCKTTLSPNTRAPQSQHTCIARIDQAMYHLQTSRMDIAVLHLPARACIHSPVLHRVLQKLKKAEPGPEIHLRHSLAVCVMAPRMVDDRVQRPLL